MIVGVLVGLAIMVGCFLIPIAHFVLAPAGPFIAGYWGIQYAYQSRAPLRHARPDVRFATGAVHGIYPRGGCHVADGDVR